MFKQREDLKIHEGYRRTQRIQENFAKKREAEFQKIQKTNELTRYYDHWGKVNTHYNNWTNPKYYELAEEALKKKKENKVKNKALDEKRYKLKTILDKEKFEYDNEIKFIEERNLNHLSLMKKRRAPLVPSTDMLEKIDNNLKISSEERRRLELEAKLYNQWRNPTNIINGNRNRTSNDNVLFSARSDNEAMAKLNWLDKQIENQMIREEKQKEMEMRNLRIQETARQREETLYEREKIRESEIKELRAIQEYHVNELKQREIESENLQQEETYLKDLFDLLKSELKSLYERNKNLNLNIPHNVQKLKMILRQQCDIHSKELENDIELLKRINIVLSNNDLLTKLINEFENQLNKEFKNKKNIENMYDSEAKENLNKCDKLWRRQLNDRECIIKDFIQHQQALSEFKLNENIIKQKELFDIRETHLSAIENANDRLKILIKDTEESDLKTDDVDKNIQDFNGLQITSNGKNNREEVHNNNQNNNHTQRNQGSRIAEILGGFKEYDYENDLKNRNNILLEQTTQNLNNNNFYNGVSSTPRFDLTPRSDSTPRSDAPKFGKKKVAWN